MSHALQDNVILWGRFAASLVIPFSRTVPCRLVDEAGEPIGPFRVWLQYAWIPGLAMSRALGDLLAHS